MCLKKTRETPPKEVLVVALLFFFVFAILGMQFFEGVRRLNTTTTNNITKTLSAYSCLTLYAFVVVVVVVVVV